MKRNKEKGEFRKREKGTSDTQRNYIKEKKTKKAVFRDLFLYQVVPLGSTRNRAF